MMHQMSRNISAAVLSTTLTIHGFKKQEIIQKTFSTKMDKISCYIKKLLVLWPDPSFLLKKVQFLPSSFGLRMVVCHRPNCWRSIIFRIYLITISENVNEVTLVTNN